MIQGKPYDGKTDVWAIGCVLYEMCALKKAFDASNLGAITVKVMRSALHASMLDCCLCIHIVMPCESAESPLISGLSHHTRLQVIRSVPMRPALKGD